MKQTDATWLVTHTKCLYCKKTGDFQKVCIKKHLKQVHEIITQLPQYQGEKIHIQDNNEDQTIHSSSISSHDEDEKGKKGSNPEPITVFLDNLTSMNSF